MAIVFLFIGLAAIAVGVRGQAGAAGKLLASEFTGPNSYVEWLAAIAILGAIGFYRPVRPAANAMLGLVILAMFIRKGQGFFDQLNSALTSATAAPTPAAANASSTAGGGGLGTAMTREPAGGAGFFGTMLPVTSLPVESSGLGSSFGGSLADFSAYDFPTIH